MRKLDQRCVALQHMNQMSNIEAACGDHDGSYRPRDHVASGNIPKFEGTRAETGFDRECASSNPLTRANQSRAQGLCPPQRQKGPPMAGFFILAVCLQTRDLGSSGTKQPIVSGGYLKNSHLWETAAGDRVRSALRGRCGSAIWCGFPNAPPILAKPSV
jgi:hypothetical protein